ncbi:MAG: DUF72 domain-containing protein [Nitrososphaerales archaeon]
MVDPSFIKIGCVSWTYGDWLGPFYPEGSKSADYLSLYSKVFDIVEIDASFYRIPYPATVKLWKEKTPSDFLFTAKLPKKITHDAKLKDVKSNLEYFESVVKNLGPKLACVIAQMPPSFKFEKGFAPLKEFLDIIDPSIRYAIEFRDSSWFREETYTLLKDKNASLAWSINEYSESPPEVTSDFLYLRFMGEHNEFSKFDRMQKEKTGILSEWLANLNDAPDSVKRVYVLMSNHFEGFAPSTANSFRKLLGLDLVNWQEKMNENAKLF